MTVRHDHLSSSSCTRGDIRISFAVYDIHVIERTTYTIRNILITPQIKKKPTKQIDYFVCPFELSLSERENIIEKMKYTNIWINDSTVVWTHGFRQWLLLDLSEDRLFEIYDTHGGI